METERLLAINNMSIRFGGVIALDRIDLIVHQGEIHALIGPNGAGKTTLLNCISRIYKSDKGRIVFDGTDISGVKTDRIVSHGVARTFQNIELFKDMSVMDNILLGCHYKRKTGLFSDMLFWGKSIKQEMAFRQMVEEVIEFLDLQAYRKLTINNVPYGVQKNVELGRALVMKPRLLLLDEPSSGLNIEETQDLAFRIEDIKAEFGITTLIVEHDMRLVLDICDKATALDYGRVLATGDTKDVVEHPDVVRSYLGEEN